MSKKLAQIPRILMENSQEFSISNDLMKTQTIVDRNEGSDQISDSDEEEDEEGMNEEKDDVITDEDSDEGNGVVDEELEALVEKAFSRNSRLQQLLKINETYKSSNSLFDTNHKSSAVCEERSPDLKHMECTTEHSDELDRHQKTHEMSSKTTHSMSKAFKKLAKELFKCTECEEWFTTDNKLQIHISKAHNKAVLNCIKCEFSTRDPKQFVRHTELHLNGRFNCSSADCSEVQDLKDQSIHERINCDKCEKSFKLQSSLFEHNKKCHITDEDCLLQCPICCHKYNCRTRYEKHVKSHDVSNRFHCQQCDQSFDKAVGLEVHVNRDHKNGCKPFICDICGQQFYANEKLLNHLSNKHKIAVYGCDSCDYKTNSKYKMSRHQLIHSADRYKCDIKGCYLVFETKYNLMVHKKNKHLIGTDLMASNSDNNSDNSFSAKNLRSNSSSCSDSLGSQMSVKNTNIFSEDNDCDNREFFLVTDFLEVNLKSGDNDDDVIQLDDSSAAEDVNSSDNQFQCNECRIGFQSEAEYETHMNVFHLNCDKNEEKLSENPILSQILQQKYQNFGQNSKNFSIVYNKNKNSLLINQNCGKTKVKTIQNSVHSPRSVTEEELEENIEEDQEKEESQTYCTFAGCQRFFTDGKAFRDHILAVHKLIKCNKCEKCFQSFSGLYKHKRRYHRSQRQIVCQFCDKKFFYQTSYEKHMETHDRTRGEDFTFRKLRQNVMKTYSCYDCNELFVEKHKYLNHLSKSHSIPAFHCELCDYKSMTKKLLASHMVRHSTAKPYKCDINACNLSFKSKNSLQIHKRVKHLNQNQRLVCQWPQCGKQFSIKQLFDYHMSSHTRSGDKPSVYESIDCDFKPSMTNDIKPQLQRHEESIKCLISGCNKVFAFNDKLNQHMSDKHDITIEPILTSDPSNAQSTSSSRERRFICKLSDCGKQLVTMQALEYHMAATHTGVKPYECKWKGCHYRTVTEPRLKLHMRTHIKPLNCPIPGCAKVFAMNRGIKRHLKNKHKNFAANFDHNFDSSSNWNQLEDSLNDSDMGQSFVESNIISIDGQNYGCNLDNIKQESIDESSEDMTSRDQNMESIDNSSEYNSNFNLITELMRKSCETQDMDNSYDTSNGYNPSVGQTFGYCLEQNSSDSQKTNDSNSSQNLLCFECNQTFNSYDLLYRHNNEFHNKYKPKYK